MKHFTRLNLIALACLSINAFSGCGNNSGSSSTNTASNAPTGASLSQELGVEVPTQEQADAQAATEINAENADKAFAELEREVAAEP